MLKIRAFLLAAVLAAGSFCSALPALAADLVITATSVVPGSDAVKKTGVAASTITAGQPVYQAAATGKYAPSDSDSATAEVRSVAGIALNGAAANQPVTIQTGGSLTIGATVTVGAGYYLSNTAGGIVPVADLSTGEYPVLLGFATTSGILKVSIVHAGVAVP